MTDRKAQDQDKFILRLPDGLRDRIKAAAEGNKRSMNAEIVDILLQVYPAPVENAFEDAFQLVRKMTHEQRESLHLMLASMIERRHAELAALAQERRKA